MRRLWVRRPRLEVEVEGKADADAAPPPAPVLPRGVRCCQRTGRSDDDGGPVLVDRCEAGLVGMSLDPSCHDCSTRSKRRQRELLSGSPAGAAASWPRRRSVWGGGIEIVERNTPSLTWFHAHLQHEFKK